MDTFLHIAGIVYSIIGTVAIAIVSGVYLAVKYFGCTLTFRNVRSRGGETQKGGDEVD